MIRLQTQIGSASPTSPIDPTLFQHGMSIMRLCRAYNTQTEPVCGSIVPVEITIYEDHSFDSVLKTSPTSEMIHKAAGIQKGFNIPDTVKIANLTWDQVAKIAEEKMKDLNTNDIGAAKKTITGTTRSMNVTIG